MSGQIEQLTHENGFVVTENGELVAQINELHREKSELVDQLHYL